MKESSSLLASMTLSHTKVTKPASNGLTQLLASLKGEPVATLEEKTRHVDWNMPVFTWAGRDNDARAGTLVHPWVCVLRSGNKEACEHFFKGALLDDDIMMGPFSTGPRHHVARQPLSSLTNLWGWGVLTEALKLGMPDQARVLLPRAVENLLQATYQASEMTGLAKAFVESRGLTQEDTMALIQLAGELLEQGGYGKASAALPARIMDEASRVGNTRLVQWLSEPPLLVNQTYAHAISLAKVGAMEQAFRAVNHARATVGDADKDALAGLVTHTVEFLRFADSASFKTLSKARASVELAAAHEMSKWLLLRHSRATSKGYLDAAFGWDAVEDTASKLSVMATFVPSQWVLSTFRGREFPPETVACLLASGRGQSDFAQCILPEVAPKDVDSVVEKTVSKVRKSKAWSKSLSRSKLVAARSVLLLEAIEPLAATLGLDTVELLTPRLPSEVTSSESDIEVWKKAVTDYRAAQLESVLVDSQGSNPRKMRF